MKSSRTFCVVVDSISNPFFHRLTVKEFDLRENKIYGFYFGESIDGLGGEKFMGRRIAIEKAIVRWTIVGFLNNAGDGD